MSEHTVDVLVRARESSQVLASNEAATTLTVFLPGPWAARLEAIASRLATPVLEVASVLFRKAVLDSENLTLQEYDQLQEEFTVASVKAANPEEVKH